jgi:hypothetical protein
MLTLAAAFLLLAIGAALFGYVGGGTLGFAAAAVFFVAFLWALAAGRGGSDARSD